MSELREILNKLIQDPELKKYPHSYNPIIIERAISALKSEFMKAVGSDKEEKGYLATDVRWHYDNGYNQRGESIRQKIKEM